MTPRHHVGRALDVATGCGSLALLLARHADHVVATDLSERAVGYARSNAERNGVALDVRLGDLFEPVADEAPFDLVTANLPFVVSPETTFVFRDGGRAGDALGREAVTQAAAVLAPEGTAVLLCNWLVERAATPWERPSSWITKTGCDGIVIHHQTADPESYARTWNEFLLAQDPPAYHAVTQRWIDAYRGWDIDGIASGAIVLRRTDRPRSPFQVAMEVPPAGDGGAQIERMLANGDRLATSSDDEIGCATLALVAPHRLEQAMAYDGEWSVAAARMVLADTAGVVGRVDPLAIHVLLRLDGVMPLQQVIASAAEDTGLDLTELRIAATTTCRELLAVGCLALA